MLKSTVFLQCFKVSLNTKISFRHHKGHQHKQGKCSLPANSLKYFKALNLLNEFPIWLFFNLWEKKALNCYYFKYTRTVCSCHYSTVWKSLYFFSLFLTFGAGENHHQPDLWGWHGFKAKFDQKKLSIEDTITKSVLWSFWYMWSSLKPCNPTGETSACYALLRNNQRLPKPKSLWSDLRASSMLSVITFSMPQTQAAWRLSWCSKRGTRGRTPNQEAKDFSPGCTFWSFAAGHVRSSQLQLPSHSFRATTHHFQG